MTIEHDETTDSGNGNGSMCGLIKPVQTVLPLTATIDELMRVFLQFPVKYIYIVDDANRFQGIVALQDVSSALLDKASAGTKHADDFLRRDFLNIITPEMPLEDGLQNFLAHQGERLPVVQNLEARVLLGVVYKTAVLDAYFRLNR